MNQQAKRVASPSLLLGIVFFVSLNAFFAFEAVRGLLASEQWVQHTWKVINQLETIFNSAKDAEMGCRGYLITGEDAYLKSYTEARRDLPSELINFSDLVNDNPLQIQHVEEMRGMVAQRLLLLDQEVEVRRTRGIDERRLLTLSTSGKAEVDQLRALVHTSEDEERRLLGQRTSHTRAAGHRAYFSIGLASLLDLLLILFLFRYISRERDLRLATEQASADLVLAHTETESKAKEIMLLNETLEEKVRLRTVELETTNRELEAFSYSVSHDLRAPLRTIDGFSLALEEDYANAIDEVGRDYISRVRNGVQRMGQLIDALLQLSRITRADLTRQEVDITAMVKKLADNFKEEPGKHALTFCIEQGMHSYADPRLLEVAFENLLGNAVKFSAKVPKPLIAVGFDAKHKAFFVRDNGAGFDMYYADRLFLAFNRLHGDKDFKGSGIGLATVARVIHRHHGRIWAESTVNQGATFWFSLG